VPLRPSPSWWRRPPWPPPGAGGDRSGVPGAGSGNNGARSALMPLSSDNVPFRPLHLQPRSSCHRGPAAAAGVGALLPLRRVVISPNSCLLQGSHPPAPPRAAPPPPPPRHLLGRLHLFSSWAIVVPLVRLLTVLRERGWCGRHGAGSNFPTLPIPRRNLVPPPPLHFVLRSVVRWCWPSRLVISAPPLPAVPVASYHGSACMLVDSPTSSAEVVRWLLSDWHNGCASLLSYRTCATCVVVVWVCTQGLLGASATSARRYFLPSICAAKASRLVREWVSNLRINGRYNELLLTTID
jgi:hypothetical protein